MTNPAPELNAVKYKTIEEQLAQIHKRLAEGDTRMDVFETLIHENRAAHESNAAALKENTDLTKEIKEILELGKSFFVLGGYIGKLARWVSYMGAAIGAIYALLHLNHPPK